MKTRTQYLKNECTHSDYYSQFVRDHLIISVGQSVGKKRLITAFEEDQNLSSIPLNEWDAMGYMILRTDTPSRFKECGDALSMGGIVCILKEAARQYVVKQKYLKS